MSYVTHTTNGFVLGSMESREADKVFWMLTEELGLVTASAKSVREETSKMRYALQDLCEVRVSLVRGKAGWKLVGAELVAPAPEGAAARTLGRLATLTRRLTPPEETNGALCRMWRTSRDTLTAQPDRAAHIELLTAARLLAFLGYLQDNTSFRELVAREDMRVEDLDAAQEQTTVLLSAVNDAIAESQL